MFVGWDWTSATHDVTVLDDAGTVVDRWAFRHTSRTWQRRWDDWHALGEPAALPVIIEPGWRPGRRAPAGRRASGRARAPHRVLGRAAALWRLRGQVRRR
jgi:hypothetical protein